MSSAPDPTTKLASCAMAGDGAFKAALEGIFFGFGEEADAIEPPTPPKWGVMPACNSTEERCRHLIELMEKGCLGFIVVDDRDKDKVWPVPFDQHRFLLPYLKKIPSAKNLKELCAQLSGEPWSLPLGSIRRYVEAIWLQELVRQFSHGSNGDVVNGFLAPARLLNSDHERTNQREIWRKFWVPFKEKVLTQEIVELQIGKELDEACRPITAWVESKGDETANDGDPERDVDLDRVMMLLTQIRTLADQRSREDSNSPEDKKKYSLGSEGQFRLLVVDDHAATWFPVFESLLEELKDKLENQNLKIDFSLNGKVLAGSSQKVFFGSYDLVLLDIFLGRDSGTDILKRLRRDFSQLPVLLWTTSRDEEITGAARLANGILLKKTVTQEQLVQSLAEWLVRGQAIRSKTLPNPFFHHTIQSADLRALAVDFHEWCLKQLDSFHALDGSFFRYFTDHGGRHMVKLWELLEKAIEPFLYDDDTLLPKIDEQNPDTIRQREIEITALYLAVICHELGMFPMQVGKHVENFSDLPKAYLEDVRTLHAVRSMALIADKAGSRWNDTQGKKLGARLHGVGFGDLPWRLAALTGYHARVFKSLAFDLFLGRDTRDKNAKEKKPEHLSDLENRIGKLKAPTASLSQTGRVFSTSLRDIADNLIAKADEETAGALMERLRKQCALFRFVDALDVSFTRNPPEFLSLHEKLPAAQYRENLKREVCADAVISDGTVKVVMRVKGPEIDLVSKIAKHLCCKRIGDGAANRKAVNALKRAAVVSNPWQTPDSNSPWTTDALDENSAICLQKPLDEWLERVWKLIVDEEGASEFIQHLRDLGILDKNALDPTLTPEGAGRIASITALSVAGELLDEYRAIVEAGLEGKIKLSEEGWHWGYQVWGKNENLDYFPSFKSFLSEGD
jgi:CheY-like chemotaxis protein